MSFDETFDVVVLGSGAAGASAAVAAATQGQRVLLLEKADVFGGGTTYSYGAIWLAIDPYRDTPATDEEIEAAVDYVSFLSARLLPRAEVRRFVRRALWAMRQLRSHGVEIEPSTRVPDHYFPIAPGSLSSGHTFAARLFRTADLGPLAEALGRSPYVPTGLTWDEAIAWGGMTDDEGWDHALLKKRREDGDHRGFGMALAGRLLHACQQAGVTIRGKTGGRSLIVENGRVIGVVAEGTGTGAGRRIAATRGVVIASGGIEGNHDFVMKHEDLPAWHTHFPPTVTGDGLLMALDIGAALLRAPHNLRVMLGYKLGVPEGGRWFRSSGVREASAPHTLIVNFRGERFGDESSFQYMVNEIKKFDVATHSFVNYPCFLVMDDQFFQRYSFAGRPKGAPAPGWLTRADTLAGLAAALGIEPERFEATVAEFNGYAAAGEDKRFGRGEAPFANVMGGTRKAGNRNLGEVSSAPFYGVPLVPTGICSSSLEITGDGAVLDNHGNTIAGLYACGNAAHDIDGGPGYQAGMSHAQGIAMGYTIGTLLGGGTID